MKVSVIIPTYNEAGVIVDCLKSLNNQTIKDFEVVVVDDGSHDNTHEVVTNFKNKSLIFDLKIYKTKHLGAGGARNYGVKNSVGNVLVFVDADMTFEKNFLKMLVKPILDKKVKGTFSKDEYVSNWDKVFARCYNLNQGWEDRKRHPKNYPDTQKVFRAILKSEFNKVGGFTPGGYNDDWSLSEKLGYEATLAEKAIFFHKNPDNLSEIFQHAIWVGKRKYKLGIIGYFVALLRSSLLVSLTLGLLYSIYYRFPAFLIFRVVYDAGVFIGILRFIFTKSGSK